MAKKSTLNEFTIRLVHCGHNNGYSDYELMKNTNAVKLIESAIIHMADSMVGEDNIHHLLFAVGLLLLKKTHKQSDKIPSMELLDVLIKNYEIIQP